MLVQRVLRETRTRLHDRVNAITEIVVGDPNHGAGGDEWMLLERGLDLGGIDVGASDQNHVGAPVGEIEIAVLVEPADVADGFPITGKRTRRGTDIAIS